ncbi:MAG: hypothetical protein QM796_10055 [Chthoniobacteraceae bacterium]
MFHKAGVKTSLLVLPRALSRRTRYAYKLPVEGYNVNDLVEHLRRHLQEHPKRYSMIVPGDDMTLRALAACPDKEWLREWFPVEPTEAKMHLATSKAALVEACLAEGLPAPQSIYCSTLEQGLAAAKQLGYPVFFKGEESSSGCGVGRAETEAQLRQVAQSLPAHHLKNFSIQKAVEGTVGSTAIFSWRGEAIQWAGAYKRAVWPAPFGASSKKEFMRHPDIELLARGVARITGFHGFFGIDWVQCAKTGRCHVIEMNPRPILQFHMAEWDGVDFADGIRHAICGGPKPAPQPATALPGVYPMFPQYLFRCLDRRDFRGLGSWFWDTLRGRGDIPWDDRSLAVGMVKKLGRHFRKTWRNKSPFPQTS